MEGLVFDIQRFSIHDGPGIRTTVFLQGCNLRCFWCHNPESQPLGPQIQFFPDKCVGCANCVRACAHNAQLLLGGQRLYVRDFCQACGRCVQECFAGALVTKARSMTVEQVLAEVERDRDYYAPSKGGVTFSGGEPLLQPDFLRALLRACKSRGLHTAVDTAANVPWESLEMVLPYTNIFLVDVKAHDEELHRRGTGVSNRLILDNLARLVQGRAEVWVRIPIIPGYNDDPAELAAIADLLHGLKGLWRIELLPFHHLGAGKYESLGLEYACAGLSIPSPDFMQDAAQSFADRGLPVHAKR